MKDKPTITRFELIDWTENSELGGGRLRVLHPHDGYKFMADLQDNGRTLKVFVEDRDPPESREEK